MLIFYTLILVFYIKKFSFLTKLASFFSLLYLIKSGNNFTGAKYYLYKAIFHTKNQICLIIKLNFINSKA